MKLEKVLDNLNSFEKNSFLKIINDIIGENPKNAKEIDKLLLDSNKDLKSIDNTVVANVFNQTKNEYSEFVKTEFVKASSQLDILIDIIIRDGNCLMKLDWFSRLYDNELKKVELKTKALQIAFESEKSDIESDRKRDYKIYRECLYTAYTNDDANNSDRKITSDELSILLTLSNQLELSQEEIKLINYLIIPVKKRPIEEVINDLKNAGVLFYSKKQSMLYVPDEVVRVLRKVREKEVADKFFRRFLKLLREPQINLICKKHNIDRSLSFDEKIKEIINEGISFTGVLTNDIYKPGITLTEKKKIFNDLCDKGLNISSKIRGSTIEEKIESLIQYFEDVENDDKVGISHDGYEALLTDLGESIVELNSKVKNEFELQNENVLKGSLLLDYNIKPRDVIELLTSKQLDDFCKSKEIKTRGDVISNLLEAYKDSDNLYLENYENIGYRHLNELKENGIKLKEAELGVKFEELTRTIFVQLGFNVDEKLRKELSTKKDIPDIIINLGNNDLIVVECKTSKESGYNKFSTVSRQLKAYNNLASNSEYRIVKSLLIAPEFSDDFISDCELEFELNLSLITASSLKKILEGFKISKHKELPFKLLMRDVLIKEDRILKAINK